VAPNRRGQEKRVLSSEAAMTGILALLVEEREERTKDDKAAEKIEVLLSKAGLSNEDISAVTGKQPSAVRMTISRAKPKKRTK
jgi:DNA-directed RNA polymerase specialized sigma24 family protein